MTGEVTKRGGRREMRRERERETERDREAERMDFLQRFNCGDKINMYLCAFRDSPKKKNM